MKISIFLQNLSSGGAEKIMVNYANFLAKNTEDKVDLILSDSSGPYSSIIDPKVNIVVLNAKSTTQSLYKLYRFIKKSKPEVLYSTLITPNLLSILVGKVCGVKVIIREANTTKEYRSLKVGLFKSLRFFLMNRIYRYSDFCLAISNVVKEDLVNFSKIRDNRVTVIYNPIIVIDTEKKIDLDKRFFHVGIVCRLTSQKNIRTIVKIIEKCLLLDLKVQFHFFGEGEERSIIEDLISKRENGVERVKLHGFNLSFYSWIKNMNLFLHIPLWEGLGNSVLEVYNSGIPMILSDIKSGYSELISDSSKGVHYVNPLGCEEEVVYIIQSYLSGKESLIGERERLNLQEQEVYANYRRIVNLIH